MTGTRFLLCMVALLAVASHPSGADGAAAVGAAVPESYDDYLRRFPEPAQPAPERRIPACRFVEAVGEHRVLAAFEGVDHPVLYSGDAGEVTWRVSVPTSGLYNIRVRYCALAGRSAPIERELLVNGECPFLEARSIVLPRLWQDQPRRQARDNRGNDIRPAQVERLGWREEVLRDREGRHPEPYLVHFLKGQQTLTLRTVREPVVVDFLAISRVPSPLAYEDALRSWREAGCSVPRGVSVKVQAEDSLWKSDPSLGPVCDRSSPATEPAHVYKVRLNTIGGASWRYPGQQITWAVDLPAAGLYQIVLRAQQNQVRGIHSTRALAINGEVPFAEAQAIEFPFGRGWQVQPLGGSRQPYLFSFRKGVNTITLEVSLGELADVIRDLEAAVLELNGLYRQIVMVTGTSPDPFRDYQLEERIPDLPERLDRQRQLVAGRIARLEALTGERGETTTALRRIVRQLSDMIREPETIADRLEAFKINVGALGAWLLDVRQLPLELDYLVVQSPDQPIPEAESGRARRLFYGAAAFAASFFVDYNTVGNVAAGREALQVWLVGGRQQAQIMKALVDERFSPREDVAVNLTIVEQQVVLPSILSGKGPDVISNLRRAQPVDFALRGSVRDLTGFEGFDGVVRRFHRSSVQPFQWNGKTYALPETQLFPVMFHRADVLAELGLEVPRTWPDVYRIIPALQKRHLDFGLPVTSFGSADLSVQTVDPTFAMLLLQHGGAFYAANGSRSALDSEEALRAFEQWTELYSNYKLPMQYSLTQEFRTGEMPIVISNFDFANVLTVSAPELRGLWSFAPVPGVTQPDGSIRRDVSGDVTGAVILKSSRRATAAWRFLSWWPSAEVQAAFGREMESLLGPAARYPTANQEALASLAWPVEAIRSLLEQQDQAQGIPEVPGGYFTGRHLENAFRTVVFQGDNPRETLLEFTDVINEEIAIKRREFGLPREPAHE